MVIHHQLLATSDLEAGCLLKMILTYKMTTIIETNTAKIIPEMIKFAMLEIEV